MRELMGLRKGQLYVTAIKCERVEVEEDTVRGHFNHNGLYDMFTVLV